MQTLTYKLAYSQVELIRKSKNFSPTDAWVYQVVTSFITNGKESFPTNKWLASEIGVCVRTIQRSIKKLMEAGYITQFYKKIKGRAIRFFAVKIPDMVGVGGCHPPCDNPAPINIKQNKNINTTNHCSDINKYNSKQNIFSSVFSNLKNTAKDFFSDNSRDFEVSGTTRRTEMKEVDFTKLQPHGFTGEQIEQLKQISTPSGGKLSNYSLQTSINYFAYDLKYNQLTNKIRTSPVNFFMGIMRKYGSYSKPDNYVDASRKRAQAALRRENEKLMEIREQHRKSAEKATRAEFEAWKQSLPDAERQKLIKTPPFRLKTTLPDDVILRMHFGMISAKREV